MTRNIEVGDVVLCTVDRIMGTIIFVKILGHGEGTIIISEIAPGRIRNLRDYVVPKKKIVCKVLRIIGDKINLSLRRVTQKEKKEVMEENKQEQGYKAIFKTILGKEKSKEVIEKIEEEEVLFDLVEEAKENGKVLEKFVTKDEAKKILEILNTQKEKIVIIKKDLHLYTNDPNGLEKIKALFKKIKDAKVKYISAGKYTIQVQDNNMKEASNKLKSIIEDLEKEAKKQDFEIKIKEK
jgi:translation initiation factor 2 alpha subunit (eIF-2alpha)